MKKLLLMSITLVIILFVSGCTTHSIKNIKADYFNIGFGQSLYEGYNKVEKDTVQSLVKAYNQIEDIGPTNEDINYDQAITITFIHNDQISGILVIDEKGVFHTKDHVENYLIDSKNKIYEQAMVIYNDVKNQY